MKKNKKIKWSVFDFILLLSLFWIWIDLSFLSISSFYIVNIWGVLSFDLRFQFLNENQKLKTEQKEYLAPFHLIVSNLILVIPSFMIHIESFYGLLPYALILFLIIIGLKILLINFESINIWSFVKYYGFFILFLAIFSFFSIRSINFLGDFRRVNTVDAIVNKIDIDEKDNDVKLSLKVLNKKGFEFENDIYSVDSVVWVVGDTVEVYWNQGVFDVSWYFMKN